MGDTPTAKTKVFSQLAEAHDDIALRQSVIQLDGVEDVGDFERLADAGGAAGDRDPIEVAEQELALAHGSTEVTGFDLLILAMFGCCQVVLGLTLSFLGSRLLPSGQAALISTLETPLMPF